MVSTDAQRTPEFTILLAGASHALHRGKHIGMPDLAELADTMRKVAWSKKDTIDP
ncbi:MAG TPA: hypothetical protein VFT72_17860 [Opitutaceae bacterium]|nr:hypothetical protein [Opitutaceae bacterium]